MWKKQKHSFKIICMKETHLFEVTACIFRYIDHITAVQRIKTLTKNKTKEFFCYNRFVRFLWFVRQKCQYIFTPLAFESFGAVGPETSVFLKELGKRMARNSGEPRSLDYLLQRISVAIQRRNSVRIRDTFRDDDICDIFM